MSKSKKNIVAIIQARMGAKRLPGKVMMEIDGVPLLELMISRVIKSELLNKIVIATSTLSVDDEIEEFCQNNNYECFRGSINDVLSRYYHCAKHYNADVIVRLTADCPLIDPLIIDDVINLYIRSNANYSSNTVPPETSKFPDGSDVEVFSFKALEKAHREANNPYDKEHVTFYFWKYDKGFLTTQLRQEKDWSKYRFTVDYPEDFDVVEFIFRKLKNKKSFGHLDEIVNIIDTNPKIMHKNAKYYFGIGWEKSTPA